MSPETQTGPAAAAPPASVAQREARLTSLLIAGALLLGFGLQLLVPPGPVTLVVASGLAGAVVLGLTFLVPGRLRTTLAGFRFTSTLLIALAVFAMLGTLVLQGKPPEVYRAKYGAVGAVILALRLDDLFHGLPFAGLSALFFAAVLASASLRWPVTARRAGFFLAHLGLLTSMLGAAASSVLSVRGRIDLFAGGDVARQVRVTRGGEPTGALAPLPFELKLDKFDLINYESEYRIGYYEKKKLQRDGVAFEDWRLVTSFDVDFKEADTARHRLPAGDSFRIKALYPDFVAVPNAAPAQDGRPAIQLTVGGQTIWLMDGEGLVGPDGVTTVLFGWERPAPPPGAAAALLLSGKERKVLLVRGDGVAEAPLAEGGSVPGNLLLVGQLLPSARRTVGYGTRSQEPRNPAALVEVRAGGQVQEQLALAAEPRGIFLDERKALLFERREQEAKAYLSHVTARQGETVRRAVISVNDPLEFAGWTLYQVNYNPKDPTYSGIEAVRDPGVFWVFTGFWLICAGVAYMFYVEPRLRGGGIDRPGTPPAQA